MKFQLILLVCLSALLSGCGPSLSHKKDYSIEVGQFLEIPLDAISREQTIKVAAKSPGKPINVHVYLADDAEEVNRKITLGKPADKSLASQTDTEEIALEATVPAGKEVLVRLQPAGPTSAEVHLEITN